MNILVVEDDQDLNFLLSHFLTQIAGAATSLHACTDGAIKALDEGYQPDVALIDFAAAGRETSVTLCRRITERHPACHVYLMSGLSRETMESASEGLGIEDFIEKPFNMGMLLQKLGTALQDSGRRTFGFTQYPAPTTAEIERLRGLLARDPSDVTVRQLLAFTLYTAGSYKDAMDEYEQVAKLGYSSFLVEYYAGHTCARLHRFKEAIDRWQRAVGKAPSPPIAERVRQRIKQALEMQEMERKLTDTAPFGVRRQ